VSPGEQVGSRFLAARIGVVGGLANTGYKEYSAIITPTKIEEILKSYKVFTLYFSWQWIIAINAFCHSEEFFILCHPERALATRDLYLLIHRTNLSNQDANGEITDFLLIGIDPSSATASVGMTMIKVVWWLWSSQLLGL